MEEGAEIGEGIGREKIDTGMRKAEDYEICRLH